MSLCKHDNCTILYDAKRKEYYHTSVVASMACPKAEPKEEMVK